MGLMIVVATVGLGYALVQRMNAGAGGGLRGDLALNQPEGTRIAGISAAEGGLAVWVTRPDGDRVLLVDARRNRVSGEIRLGQ